ncbi:hypothetical protein RMSM_00095 [Rhodopirellula maiorica SM1]|uniref:Uncharacterized protein n=1 Tax=Rhodopirellula maiorica SM1 TaxID=1265738 RepID=M5RUL2_9BACT|nr:hypothetical protein [Rhodopirellula maiorica]EMI22985.1 hypothetical protein RMSM_00095 [Rhodopirellula maiorica SM1]
MAYSIVEKPPPDQATPDERLASSDSSKIGRYDAVSFYGDLGRLDSKTDEPSCFANDEFRYIRWVMGVFILMVIVPAVVMMSYLILNPESFQ